eukprot:Awhi_evm1s13507
MHLFPDGSEKMTCGSFLNGCNPICSKECIVSHPVGQVCSIISNVKDLHCEAGALGVCTNCGEGLP